MKVTLFAGPVTWGCGGEAWSTEEGPKNVPISKQFPDLPSSHQASVKHRSGIGRATEIFGRCGPNEKLTKVSFLNSRLVD